MIDPADIVGLQTLISRHLELTGSERARVTLDNWDTTPPQFVKVI